MKKLALLLTLPLLWGCDFISNRTVVEGRVLDASTGEAIEGMYVGLITSGGFGSYGAIDSTRTDARGKYRLSAEVDEPIAPHISVNQGGNFDYAVYNTLYSTYSETVQRGRKHRVNVKLERRL